MKKTDFSNTGTELYSQFIHKSRYARWLEEEGRRETWDETVDRYVNFFRGRFPDSGIDFDEIRDAIYNTEAMPSMRALMTAGKALERSEVAGYNCSFLAVDSPRAFDEAMYVLMCGTGLGFSVERQLVNKLPEIAEEFHDTDTTIVVADSKIGWAKSFRELISLLYAGQVPNWDISRVRPAGSPLKTFGGRASGPEPLVDLFEFSIATFKRAAGRKLSSTECHDLMCKIAQIVVVGGVRRSALISLSNPSDDRMRLAKSGQWWMDNPQRSLANNTAAYTEKPEFEVFLQEWQALYNSKSGERGFLSRPAAHKKMRELGYRDPEKVIGLNPCSEILLRSCQLCNLSEVVIRAEDSVEDIKRKIRVATILGTLQSTLTNFKYVRKIWKTNCEEERLLGVSLTGIMDHPLFGDETNPELPGVLKELRTYAREVNKEYAQKLGIPCSTAITTVKPSGTVSQLVNSASGIHPRFSDYYIRRVRADKKDPLAQFMYMNGFPCEEDVMNKENYVFSFPIESPKSTVTVDQVTSLRQLELWKVYHDNWAEHNVSITCYYSNDEFLEVGNWLWRNFESVTAVSFLPKSDHVYKQAPYEEISRETYLELKEKIPSKIVWEDLALYESTDSTVGSQSLACSGGSCEVVDLVSPE